MNRSTQSTVSNELSNIIYPLETMITPIPHIVVLVYYPSKFRCIGGFEILIIRQTDLIIYQVWEESIFLYVVLHNTG